MKKALIAFTALTVAAPVAMPAPAFAQHHKRHHGDRHWDAADHYRAGKHERRLTRADRIYRGRDGRYYCKRDDGTTGLVIGAVAGGVLGNLFGDQLIGGGKTLGTLLGAGGGALLGRELDRGDIKCR
jgi:uncharacterized protein YcfJ